MYALAGLAFCFSKLIVLAYRIPDHLIVTWPNENPLKQNAVISAGTVIGEKSHLLPPTSCDK